VGGESELTPTLKLADAVFAFGTMGASRRGDPDEPSRRGDPDERERSATGSGGAERRGPTTDEPRLSDGTRLSRVGDRLGIDALGRLSWRRHWVGDERPWRVSASEFPRDGSPAEQAQFLVRYAVLAPSSHNTQPWLFTVDGDEVRLFADLNRWLTVADPDKRELYLSLGAALENLLVAADHFGLGYDVRYMPGSDTTHAATVRLWTESEGRTADEFRNSRLFEAIPRRRTDRGKYRREPVPRGDLRELRDVCIEDDVALQFVTDAGKLAEIADLAARADRRLFADPAYRRELARWIGRGAFGHSWPKAKAGASVIRYLNVGPQQARKDAELLRDAPVVAVLRTEDDSRSAQIRAGQAFERVSLLAAALDAATHPMSALLEVPALRRDLTDLLGGADWPPQHLFRLGYGEGTAGEPSPRRPANAVLID
jgi:hypothetical protein